MMTMMMVMTMVMMTAILHRRCPSLSCKCSHTHTCSCNHGARRALRGEVARANGPNCIHPADDAQCTMFRSRLQRKADDDELLARASAVLKSHQGHRKLAPWETR